MALAGIATSVLGLLFIPLIGIVAAIAIPSLLRARVSANEAAAIGDIRTVISAEAAYQSANGGFYEGRMECLTTPSNCIPNYPATAPTFLDARFASSSPKSGYRRQFFPGAAPGMSVPAAASASSVGSYAYVAVPVNQGQTGVRAFCGDSNGVVCYTTDGRAPEVRPDGTCELTSCQLLQ